METNRTIFAFAVLLLFSFLPIFGSGASRGHYCAHGVKTTLNLWVHVQLIILNPWLKIVLSKLKGISLAKNWCRRLLIVKHFSYTNYHFLNFELQQSYSQWQLTKPEGFKYQASDGKGSAIHTLFAQDFTAVGSSSFNPHLTFMPNFLYIPIRRFGWVNRGA